MKDINEVIQTRKGQEMPFILSQRLAVLYGKTEHTLITDDPYTPEVLQNQTQDLSVYDALTKKEGYKHVIEYIKRTVQTTKVSTYSAINRRKNDPVLPEQLQDLLNLVILYRQSAKLSRLVKGAGFSALKTFEDYSFEDISFQGKYN